MFFISNPHQPPTVGLPCPSHPNRPILGALMRLFSAGELNASYAPRTQKRRKVKCEKAVGKKTLDGLRAGWRDGRRRVGNKPCFACATRPIRDGKNAVVPSLATPPLPLLALPPRKKATGGSRFFPCRSNFGLAGRLLFADAPLPFVSLCFSQI